LLLNDNKKEMETLPGMMQTLITALGRLRQDNFKFKASLG
jgi:hypothetical protein